MSHHSTAIPNAPFPVTLQVNGSFRKRRIRRYERITVSVWFGLLQTCADPVKFLRKIADALLQIYYIIFSEYSQQIFRF